MEKGGGGNYEDGAVLESKTNRCQVSIPNHSRVNCSNSTNDI